MKDKITILILILVAFFPLLYLHNYIERSKHRDENIHYVVAPIPARTPVATPVATPAVKIQKQVKPTTTPANVERKVKVRGYTKKDGTRVEAYTRSYPNKGEE